MRANDRKALLFIRKLLAPAIGALALSNAAGQGSPPPERPVGPPAGTPGRSETATESATTRAERKADTKASAKTGEASAKKGSVEVADAVKGKIAASKEVDVKQLRVEVQDGTVVLFGSTKTMAEKTAAAEIAKEVKGAKTVRNEITIRP
jgi:osmotically-inducible protein OsmY